MIKSFRDSETEKVFDRQFSRKLPTDIQLAANRKLWMLDAAVHLSDLKLPPSNSGSTGNGASASGGRMAALLTSKSWITIRS
jgi:plasmid maintenance system killer protein